VALTLAAVAYAQEDRLDSSFDGDGRQTTKIDPYGKDAVHGLAIDAAGRIVAAGGTERSVDEGLLTVVRYLANGALDTSFSGDGIQTADASGSGDWNTAFDLAIQPDGRIVAGGGTKIAHEFQYAAARFMPDGSLDTSFSGDGLQATDVVADVAAGDNEVAHDVALAPNGAVVLAGNQFDVVRYEADGDPDPTFSGDGVRTLGLDGLADTVAVQPDGKILVGGFVGSADGTDGMVVRLETDGDLDPSFSGDGLQRIDLGGGDDEITDVVVVGGRVLVAGSGSRSSGAGFVVALLTGAGELDPNFGSGGMTFAVFPGDSVQTWGVRVGAGGTVVVGGGVGVGFGAVRLAANGAQISEVTSVRAPQAGGNSILSYYGGLALQADGRVVLGAGTYGEDGSGQAFSLVRFASLAPLPGAPGGNGSDGPVAGKSFNAEPVSGKVRFRCRGDSSWTRLREESQLPIGCRIDARNGKMRIVSAANRDGSETQSGKFHGGIFKVKQRANTRPVTELVLDGKLVNCGNAAAAKRHGRQLEGNAEGRFRTRGRYSTATVSSSSIWIVKDSCDGTLTRVRDGKAKVRDLIKDKTFKLSAGERYLAKRRAQ
jgi:uncharacterized delta-60 repeat protein